MLARGGSLMLEEAGLSGENPRVQAGDHHALSHTTTVGHGDRTRVAEGDKRVY